MGKVFDKHGRMKHDDPRYDVGSDICGECGARVQNMNEHKALAHPKYRDEKLHVVLAKADPNQTSLNKYPDTGESADAYDEERKAEK